LQPGDLVKIEWFDASVGKSLSGGLAGIDVPVKSWGIYIGLLGQKNKHIILAQNNFQYADDLYDIDHTAIPTSWTSNMQTIQKKYTKTRSKTTPKLFPKRRTQNPPNAYNKKE